ncbi:hypothetical protein IAU60_003412 [Kwoniella sp. DSM 27419]
MSMTHEDLDTELELIAASLLPAESIDSSPSGSWPRDITITSHDSHFSLHVVTRETYRSRNAVTIEVKSGAMGRDEAAGWQAWVDTRMEDWDEEQDYPLYQLLTTHMLSLLAPSSPSPPPEVPCIPTPADPSSLKPHHALLISHHLLSSTKRKDLVALSSSLSLTGFSKTGHPGIMYAIGTLGDLEEWIREVKSWNWLALRVRVTPELIIGEEGKESGKGRESGARGGKGRGDWTELEKINEALDWLRQRGPGRDKLLMDFGVGGGRH